MVGEWNRDNPLRLSLLPFDPFNGQYYMLIYSIFIMPVQEK